MTQRIISVLMFVWLLFMMGCDRPPEEPKGVVYQDAPAVNAIPTYRFAVHPLLNPTALAAAYQPLVDHLNANIQGARFELEASRNYQAFEQKVNHLEPDVILPNPWQTLKAQAVGYHVIAMAGDAQDFKGVFIARKDARIKTMSELKGKTVSTPSPTALAACIMPQYFMHQQGINVNKDIQMSYVGTHESTIMSVYLGQSDIGTTYPPPWRAFQLAYPDKAAQLELVWQTDALVNNSVMVKSTLPAAVVDQLKDAILTLTQHPKGMAILRSMETQAFYPANDDSYKAVAEFIARFEREVRPVMTP
jgi:phosphonate transport system substrate-binding protein